MTSMDWFFLLPLLVLLVCFITIAIIQSRQATAIRLQKLEDHFKPEPLTEPVGPKLQLVLHHHPMGGWWLGLKKLDEGSGWWNSTPQMYKLFNKDDVVVVQGSFTYSFLHAPKGHTIILAQSSNDFGVVSAMATTGFNGTELWAELDDWAPAEPMP